MQQQELAQIRYREANLTALAAIGPRKKRKTDSPGAEVRGGEGGIHVLDVFLRYNEGNAEAWELWREPSICVYP